jgi:hypothetical protein
MKLCQCKINRPDGTEATCGQPVTWEVEPFFDRRPVFMCDDCYQEAKGLVWWLPVSKAVRLTEPAGGQATSSSPRGRR